MRVFMTGGTGLVGTALSRQLVAQGHEVSILTRNSSSDHNPPDGPIFIHGNPTKEGPWQDQAAEHDVCINLAGASIFRRWTQKAKTLMRESRLLTTKNLVASLERRKGRDTVLP